MQSLSKRELIVISIVAFWMVTVTLCVIANSQSNDRDAESSNRENAGTRFDGGYGDTSTLARSTASEDIEICRFMHYRWLYYQERDGAHLPDEHDSLVMEDTADYFGITPKEAKDRFWRAPYVDYTRLRLSDFESEFPSRE